MATLSLFDPLVAPQIPAPADEVAPALEMRPYQREALDAVRERFDTHRSTLVVSATGTGKTVLFAHLVDEMLKVPGRKKVLVLAHRDELIQQARQKIARV